jgi:hypothetical protein
MSEQIQKAWLEYAGREMTSGEMSALRTKSYDAFAFHGGYTACQSRVRGVIEGKIAAYVMELECYDECTIGYRSIQEMITRLREVLGEI